MSKLDEIEARLNAPARESEGSYLGALHEAQYDVEWLIARVRKLEDAVRMMLKATSGNAWPDGPQPEEQVDLARDLAEKILEEDK